MEESEKLRLLKKALRFTPLSDGEYHRLVSLTREYHYSDGESVFFEGDAPDRFYIVAEGQIKVVKHSTAGKDLIIAVFTPGHTFGEVAVFDGSPYPASAFAMGDAKVLGLGRSDLLDFFRENPGIALKIINVLGQRLRYAHDRLRDMAAERAEQRMASTLFMLTSKLGATIPFNRQDIASMAGITRETAYRLTTRLSEKGIIKTGRGSITVLDEGKLREVSEGTLPL